MSYPSFVRHYKGGIYWAMMVTRNTETNERMVVYLTTRRLWVQPQKRFEGITENGKRRFVRVDVRTNKS